MKEAVVRERERSDLPRKDGLSKYVAERPPPPAVVNAGTASSTSSDALLTASVGLVGAVYSTP
jgi:hypothetical protein